MRFKSPHLRHRRATGGFTLVEMLTVITIIGILAAILIPTAGAVIRSSRLNAIAIEVNSLSQAIEVYKSKYNDYPPDFSNLRAVDTHIRIAFPRNQFPFTGWVAGRFDKNTMPDFNGDGLAGPDPQTLDPAESLVFWLSLLKSDQRNPFATPPLDATSAVPAARQALFEFNDTYLTDVDADGWKEYASSHAQGAPYVYFDGRLQNDEVFDDGRCVASGRASVCAYAWAVYPAPPAGRLACVNREIVAAPLPSDFATPFGIVRPYRDYDPSKDYGGFVRTDTSTFPREEFSTDGSPQFNSTPWVNAGKFQIIAPGLDQSFGTDHIESGQIVYKTFPSPNYLLSADAFEGGRDDITDFSESKTVEAGIP